MRKIILYIATSLNGYIAKSDGSVDWLESIPSPNKDDYGYTQFYDSIDTTIQGYNTYKQIIDWGIEFPYKGKINYVLTRKQNIEDTEYVKFVKNDHIKFISDLNNQFRKNTWLIGGGQVNTTLLNANLIDEVHHFIMPIILDGGINIFEGLEVEKALKIIESKTYKSNVVRYTYRVN